MKCQLSVEKSSNGKKEKNKKEKKEKSNTDGGFFYPISGD
ncbi:conserved domain protein [Yersinia pestis KIM D27]|nr:conserved domain protein [Yersinia pestis KIM D27]